SEREERVARRGRHPVRVATAGVEEVVRRRLAAREIAGASDQQILELERAQLLETADLHRTTAHVPLPPPLPARAPAPDSPSAGACAGGSGSAAKGSGTAGDACAMMVLSPPMAAGCEGRIAALARPAGREPTSMAGSAIEMTIVAPTIARPRQLRSCAASRL